MKYGIPGDRIAAISLSWGGPGAIPHRYEIGKKQFSDEFAVEVVETRHALRDPTWLARNPKARADDLLEAFADRPLPELSPPSAATTRSAFCRTSIET